MNVPQIRLESTSAKIEISTRQGQLFIEQPQGDLQIEQPKADVNYKRVPGKLTIDQTQAREDIDLKSARRRIEESAQLGKQDLLTGVARRIQDGEELMKIENGFQAIPYISKRNSEGPKKEFGIGFLPKEGSVQISFVPGEVEIEITPNKPKINYQINKPYIEFQSGKVNIGLIQYASLKIDFESK